MDENCVEGDTSDNASCQGRNKNQAEVERWGA